MISSGKISLEDLLDIQPQQIVYEYLPYDLIGSRIVVTKENFSELDTKIQSFFREKKIELISQQRFSFDLIVRKSYIGKVNIDNLLIPFQIQLWETVAANFELLSYGNLKMNKILLPIVENWKDLITKEIDEKKLIAISLQSLSKLIG